MRRLILSTMVTLDGFTAGSDGDLDVFGEDFADDELLGYIADLLRGVDGFVYGRVAYELLADFWPRAGTAPDSSAREIELAGLMNATPKIVVSRTMTDPAWTPASVIGGTDLAAEVSALKAQPGRDLALFAGATVMSTLAGLGLVDEYRLMVYPVALGEGQALFRAGEGRRDLELVDTRTFRSGVVLLRYRPAIAPG